MEESLDELRAIHHPHDTLFRSVFADPELAGEVLRSRLAPETSAAIDWAAMRHVEGTFVDEALGNHQADLLFATTITGRPALLYLLLEHKADEDPFTAFQLLRYVVRIWERWRKGHPDATTLPAVLPVVLHHGAHPWRGPCDLTTLIDLGGLPPEVTALQPRFAFAIDDLTAQSEAELRGRGISVRALLPLLHMQWLRRRADTAALLREWLSLYEELLRAPGGQPIAIQLTWYVAAVSETAFADLRDVYHELGPVMERTHMSAAEQLLNQGMQQGTVRTVLQLLERRFGRLDPTIVARVRGATLEELDGITARLLTATTLEAVFGS